MCTCEKVIEVDGVKVATLKDATFLSFGLVLEKLEKLRCSITIQGTAPIIFTMAKVSSHNSRTCFQHVR